MKLAARGGGRVRVANGLARRAQITTKSRLSGASPVASVANWVAGPCVALPEFLLRRLSLGL